MLNRSFFEVRRFAAAISRIGTLLTLLALVAPPSVFAGAGAEGGILVFSDGFESGDASMWPLPGVPFIVTSAGSTHVLQDTGPQTIDGALTVSDSDSGNLLTATVTILDPLDGPFEELVSACPPGFVVSYGTNSLTVSGSIPVAMYEDCLRTITWENTSGNPTGGSRTIAFTVSDGTTVSPVATKTVDFELCAFSISPVSKQFNTLVPTSATTSACVTKTFSATVTATTNCSWNTLIETDVVTSPPWLVILSGGSGIGTGGPQTVTIRVLGNAHGVTARNGTITVLRGASLDPTAAVLDVFQRADPTHTCP